MKISGKIFAICTFSIILIFYSFTANNVCLFYPIKTVVIDAGHGGNDPGCLGKQSQEKNVALQISLKLGEYIKKNFKDIDIIYTRDSDKFVELHERANLANKNRADLFISVHCNAGSSGIYGTETYTMGLHRTEANLKVSEFENQVILLEKNYKQNYDGFDPNSPESYIIFSLFQNANIEKSLLLASKVEQKFKDNEKLTSRGVKQAGFLVLYKTTMPSILIETGFLTNKNEEKFLASTEGQENVASSIFKAFKEYKDEIEDASK